MVRRMILVVLMLGLWAQLAGAEIRESGVEAGAPASSSSTGVWGDAGYGVLAMVTNLVYMPAKFVYAGLGLVTGSLAYVLTVGDGDTAMSIWNPSIGGTYVVTPSMLRSEQPILFSGASYSKD